MTVKNQKMAVLAALEQLPEGQTIGLPELLEVLGADFAERTVRRWLASLAVQGVIKKICNRR